MPYQAIAPFDLALSTCQHIVECQGKAHSRYELVRISSVASQEMSTKLWQRKSSRLCSLFVYGILHGDGGVVRKRIRCDWDGILESRHKSETQKTPTSESPKVQIPYCLCLPKSPIGRTLQGRGFDKIFQASFGIQSRAEKVFCAGMRELKLESL